MHSLIKRYGRPVPAAEREPRQASVAAPSPIPAAAPAQPQTPAPAPAPPRTCLVVDDSRVVRKVARRVVESLGYSVTEAENGEEALARCKSAMPALILTDWNMPVMSGIDFVTQLRALAGGNRARIVFCTSNSGAKDIHKGIEAGADEYVIKPFDEHSLQAKLQVIGAA